MDRRIARTRKIMQEALSAFTLKLGYGVVTIKQICDAAYVRRSTFYAHFTNKDDLNRSGLAPLRHHPDDAQTIDCGSIRCGCSHNHFRAAIGIARRSRPTHPGRSGATFPGFRSHALTTGTLP